MNRRVSSPPPPSPPPDGYPGRLPAQKTAAADLSKYSEAFVPARAITKGPAFHWFAYYDKLQFDPTNRFVLGNRVSFEHRTPTADDRIQVGMIDLEDSDRWIELGKSDAWGWQQGCNAAMGARLGERGALERPRGRALRRAHQEVANRRDANPAPRHLCPQSGREWG